MKTIQYNEYGPPDVLHLQEMKKLVPGESEIIVRVHAVSVNYGDLLARNFKNTPFQEFNMSGFLWLPVRLAFGWSKPKKRILGSEFAGEVDAIGTNTIRFKVGDQVFGYRGQKMGTYAEYLCTPENKTVEKMPTNMSYAEAAVLPYGGLTALQLLRKVKIRPGQKMLINGASGSIGSAAVQLAKEYGADVTGVCGTPRVEFVKSLGAIHVIDYTQMDFTENGEKYDLIFDILGKSSFKKCKKSLTKNGRYLLASFKTREIWQMARTSLGSAKKVICALSSEDPADLAVVRDLAEQGKLKSIVDRQFPMEQATEAHRYAESGHKKGNVVITMTPDLPS